MKEVVRGNAASLRYLHRDFHGLMNLGIAYVAAHFGQDAVRDYLRQFADAFYAPLREALTREGLDAMERHLRDVYAREDAPEVLTLTRTADRLLVEISVCPAVRHIRESGSVPSPLFYETSSVVYAAVCAGTGWRYEMRAYDAVTGAAVHSFCREGERV